MGETKIIDFESFAASKSASNSDMGEAGLHKRRCGESKKSWRRKVEAQRTKDAEWMRRRDAARSEYRAAVDSGAMRPLTRRERTERIASGHPDNPSVQAARRMLAKWNGHNAASSGAPR